MNNSNQERGKVWIILVLLITIIPAAIWYFEEQQTSKELFNPHIETIIQTPILKAAAVEQKQFDANKLNQKIEKILSDKIPVGQNWNFGIALTDPITKQKYGKNEKEVYDAASTGKIAILATLYDQIVQKKIGESDKITIKSADVQDYGTGSIRYKQMPATYTVRELAELMIKQSDNTAAHVMANKVGRDTIASYVKNIGMENTDAKENTTTPYDINVILEHIYDLKDSNPTTAGFIMKIMTDSDFETRLPALLPQETIVAHKIGTGIAQLHDAGIVLLNKRPYIISIFSKRISNEKQAEQIIAEISKAVYEEYSQLEQ